MAPWKSCLVWKKDLSLGFLAVWTFQVLGEVFTWKCNCSRAKSNRFHSKSEFQVFLWYPAAILVYHGGIMCRLHTELYKFPWNVLANNSRTLYRTDLRLGEVFYLLIFDNIWNSWRLLLNGFEFIFVWRDSATRQYVCLATASLRICNRDRPWPVLKRNYMPLSNKSELSEINTIYQK